MKRPLDGIKILDLSRYLPGPYATQFMADFGADVIKIEEPGGELGRALPPFIEGMGLRFSSVNRNKKSLTLNLKSEKGRDIFLKLAEDADVVVDQFRPGVMERLGIGYSELRKINKGIIYCSITGYGLSGPWINKGGHDINYLNTAGVSALTAGRNGEPVLSSVQMADVAGGSLYAITGILLALFARTGTGEGQLCDISMMDGALSLLSYTIGEWAGEGKPPVPGKGFLTGGFAMYNTYRCKDGRYVGLGAIEQVFWKGFCLKIGREDLVQFQYSPSEQERIIEEIGGLMMTKTRDEWVEFFSDSDICFTPVLDLDEVSIHEQVRAREMMVKAMNFMGSGKDVYMPGNPVKLSETPYSVKMIFPRAGEHTEEILLNCGYPIDTIKSMREEGVV
jgi:crotonobetainyl-CoA:carnitine CoA-transferase CaiB-like acyl-CoA transferase